MEIIENKVKKWSQQDECSHCESVLLMSLADIVGKRQKTRSYCHEENELLLSYTCPACGRENRMHCRDIPAFVWWKISDATPEYGPPKNLWQRFRRWLGLDWEPK